MKKFSKVLIVLLMLCEACFFVACKTNKTDDPKHTDDPTEELRKALDSIQLDTTNVKKEYYLGQSFDSAGLKVTANFANKTSEDVSSQAVINSQSFDSNALGEYPIIVSYTFEGRVRTSNYTVKVKSILDNNIKHLVGLDVATDPIDKEFVYNIGDDVDLTGVSITAVYSDNTTTPIEFENVTVDMTSIDKTKAGIYVVAFSIKDSYTSDGATQEVTVKNFLLVTYLNPVTKIEFKSGKTEFDFGSEFTMVDWVFEATYTNGDTAEITFGQFEVNDKVNTNLSGTTSVTVRYLEMGVLNTTNVEIVIKPDPNANAGLNEVLDFSQLSSMNPIAEDIVISYFRIKAESKMRIDTGQPEKTFGDMKFTTRININGSYSSSRCVEITMPKEGTIRVIFSQGNAGRKLSLYKNGQIIESSTEETVDNTTLVEHVFTVDEAGVYELGCDAGGIYIWYIALGEPLEA